MEIDNLIAFIAITYMIKKKTYEEFMEAIDKVDEDYDYYSCKVDLKRRYRNIQEVRSIIKTDNDIKVCINY